MTHDDHTHALLLDGAARPLGMPEVLRKHGLRLFYGDLHNHTSYSDGRGTPEAALRQMRERGLHFAAITDHADFFERDDAPFDRWAATGDQVAALNGPDFVAIRGFEWTSPHQGHSNVWCSAEPASHRHTGDTSMVGYYDWLRQARPIPGAQVLAGFNHPGREPACFDGCAYAPKLDEQIVTLECFNRTDDYGERYFAALDRGWHVGAIGVSDHHGDDWGSPTLPRAGMLAPALTLAGVQRALLARQVFATRAPNLVLLLAGNDALMGARLRIPQSTPLQLGVWCDDPTAGQARTRLELWTNGPRLLDAHETRGLQQIFWRAEAPPPPEGERWFAVRLLHGGEPRAYSSPVWAWWDG